MPRPVIACYKPKKGKERELVAVVRDHIPTLRAEGLVTDKPPLVLRCPSNGTIIESFEWESTEAIARARDSETVRALWKRFAEVCDYVPLAKVPEAKKMFAEFEIIEIRKD